MPKRKHTLFLRGLALSVVLVGKCDKFTDTTFQLGTFLVTFLPDILDVVDLSR
jgi:hypothetical protein